MDQTFRLQVINPTTKEVKKRVVYFWDVPEQIRSDLLANKFTKRLQAFFGPEWKEKIFADDEKASTLESRTVEVAVDFDLEGDEEEIATVAEESKLYVFDATIFPEDTMFAIKEKIYMTIGIPVYRQHLFYLRGSVHETGGTVFFGEDQYFIDEANDTHEIRGVMTDNKFNAQQDQLSLRTSETIKAVGDAVGEMFYLYDLADYVERIGADTLLSDKYIAGLIHKCIVQKYFPVMDAVMFRMYLSNESALKNNYPIITASQDSLLAKYAFQREKAIDIYENPPDYKIDYIYNRIVLTMDVQVAGSSLFYLQNIFNTLVCDDDMVYVRALVDLDGQRYKLIKYHHDLLPEEFVTIEKSIAEVNEFRNHVAIYFYHTCPDEETYLSHLMFYPDGKYTIEAYGGTRGTTVDKVIADYEDDVSAIIAKVNADPSTRRDVYMYADYAGKYFSIHGMYVKMVWENAMTQVKFAEVRKIVEAYERGGIIQERNNNYAKTADNFMLKILKGVSRSVERFLFYHSIETRDYYSIMREEDKKRVWDHRFAGAILDILRGITHVEFTIENIEYDSFIYAQKYVMTIIRDIAAIPDPKNKIKEYSKDAKKKAAELDPELYNFTLDNGARYARIAQKKSQPIGVFTVKEVAAMSKLPPHTHKFFSYTTGEDLWYQCPADKPRLGFIAEKHPKGFCIPKCKAVQTNGEKNLKIMQACLDRQTIAKGDLGAIATAANIIKFGKKLDVDRRCYVHPSIAKLLKSQRIYLKNVCDSSGTLAEQMLATYAVFADAEINDVISRLQAGITDELVLSVNTNGMPTEAIKEDLTSLDSSVLPWKDILPYFIAKILGNVVILFETEVLVDNEILHSDNSAITMTINSGVDTSRLLSRTTLLLCEVRGAIYAVVDMNDNLQLSEKVIGALSVGRAQLDKKKIVTFNDYDAIEAKLKIHARYIVGSKIQWVIAEYKGELICIQAHQSFTKQTHKPVKTLHDTFRRRDYKLPVAAIVAWLVKAAPYSSPTFLCTAAISDLAKDATAKATFIGIRIGESIFWHDDVKLAELQDALSATKATWAFHIEFASKHYDAVNKAITNHVGPDLSIYETNAKLYYNIHIYSLVKRELFSVLVYYRDAKLRAKAAKVFFRYRKDGIILPTADDFPYSSSKLISVVVNAEATKADLDALIFKEEPLSLFKVLSSMPAKAMFTFIFSVISQFITQVSSIPSGHIRNIETSQLNYAVAVKTDEGIPVFVLKHAVLSSDKTADSLFYRDGRLLVYKPMLVGIIKALAGELATESLVLSQINAASIHLVYNHFAFTPHAKEKIVIESA